MQVSNTYTQAKHIFNSAPLMDNLLIKVDPDTIRTLRKHLSEMIKRKKSTKKFTSRLLDNNKLLIVRIR